MKLRTTLRRLVYKIFPLKLFLKCSYWYIYKANLSLKNPKRFSEKIWWLKIYNGIYLEELIKKCYDKYTVREYVENKIGSKYLNNVLGVYDDANDIDFEALPDSFVLKVTQSCGYNLICPEKRNIDKNEATKCLNEWLNSANTLDDLSEESYVFNGNAKIICEEFLSDKNGNIPDDYRIYCFNGEPKFIVCDVGTTEQDGTHGHDIKRNVYDLNWNLIEVNLGRPYDKNIIIDKPSNLEEMLDVAKKLSEDFVFVRVDLYNIDGKIVFGELTWIPMGGFCVIEPVEYDYKFGELLELPNVNIF